jgi:hypothetical protein
VSQVVWTFRLRHPRHFSWASPAPRFFRTFPRYDLALLLAQAAGSRPQWSSMIRSGSDYFVKLQVCPIPLPSHSPPVPAPVQQHSAWQLPTLSSGSDVPPPAI